MKVMAANKLVSQTMYDQAVQRASRYAAIQERLISPEGTYPPIGRSLPYRIGAFQTLAQMSLTHALPADLPPAQVRSALTAVMKRQMEMPGTYDAKGWLQLGFAGHQPDMAESYLCTGSLYLCSVGFLPLGLPPAIHSGQALPWTGRQRGRGAVSSSPLTKR